MKIQNLLIDNFLRLDLLDLALDDATAHLIAGSNEAGKSSIQEAIRFALLGETVRVTKKGDYKLMIRDGAKEGSVTIMVDGERVVRDVGSGKQAEGGEYIPHQFLPFLLNAQLAAGTSDSKRKEMITALLHISINGNDVSRRMSAKGVANSCIEIVLPLLRSGFDAALTDAKRRASETRAEWTGLTGAARYGSKIASAWEAEKPEGYDAETLIEAQEQIVEVQAKIDDLRMKLAGYNNQMAQSKEKRPFECCECGAKLRIQHGIDPETGSYGAIVTIYSPPSEEEIEAIQASLYNTSGEIGNLERTRDKLAASITDLSAKRALYENAEQITAKAKVIHERVQKWEKACDVLAPEGIPAEILSDALKPINDRLRDTSIATGWPQVTITPTMEIEADGRRYSLLSESAQWRADAAITEAIASLSGLGLLILDRIDVLDIKNRSALIRWIGNIMGDYETILMFGTLKAAPASGLPDGMVSHWIEAGNINQSEEAA